MSQTMKKSLLSLSVLTLFLSACSSSPAPVDYKNQGRSVEYETVRPESGVLQEANIERLYPNKKLFVCRGIHVSNKPKTKGDEEVVNYYRLVVVNGKVPVVTAPANNACITSGFGNRNGKPHKGLDIASRPASQVFSGAAGTIVEAGWNGGYGRAILIDHGNGVYTRYAHLEKIYDGIKVGAYVHYGKPIGKMGTSGHSTGIHLHYEILTGVYRPGIVGRGLTPHNPFDFPEWIDPRLS